MSGWIIYICNIYCCLNDESSVSRIVVSNSPATSSAAPVSTLRTVLTTGLRPQQLLLQPMQPPAYRVVTQTSSNTVASANPATIIPDNDPSLDENLLNILAADGDDDDPMEDHYRRHRGERPFQCHVFENKFRYKGRL